jgi:hypothetical protein
MDHIQFSHYELCFRVAFLEAKGSAFQTLFERVMAKLYPGDFMACKPWGSIGDKKNDGYLPSSRTLFQLYGPTEIDAATTVAKIEEDFNGALPHWGQYLDKWVFLHNADALPPTVLAKILELKQTNPTLTIETWSWEELRIEFNRMSLDGKRALFGSAPTNEAKQNLLMKDLEEVLEHIAQSDAPEGGSPLAVPPGKIEANSLSSSVASLLKAGMEKAELVGKYFDGHPDPLYGDRTAGVFRAAYIKLRDKEPRMHSDEVFSGLETWAGASDTSTPTQRVAILTVLAYFFEQCEIFEPPPAS